MGLQHMKCFSLEPLLKRFFYWYGGLVYSHRWLLFLLPLFLTALFSIGFLWFGELSVDDPAYVFTPRDARWKKELATFTTNWPLDENKFLPGKSFESKRFVNVLIKSKDHGSILRPNILDEIQLLNTLIMQNVSVPTYDGKFNLTYQDLCLSYDWVCGANEHVDMFRQMEKLGRVINLSYPKGGNKDTPAYLGTALGDITLNKTDNTVLEAKITQLFYFLKQEPESVRKYSTDFEYAVEHFFLHEFQSDLISISFAHYQSLEDGLNENGERFAPNFVFSFVTLSIFCVICSFVLRKGTRRLDFIQSKPYLAFAGLFNTLLSLISSFGLLMLIGIPYNIINTIIPFLIIAIGIDDMFIMNACWYQTDHNLPTQERMALMMEHAGVAVSITNITDILAFLIGCITELPGIEVFCIYAFASVTFCYIYQLTYFAGFMAIMGEAERERRHCLFLYKLPEEEKPKKSNAIYAIDSSDSTTKEPLPDNDLELSNRSSIKSNDRPYVQSIYVAGEHEESYIKKFEPKPANYHLEFGANQEVSLHGSIAQLPRHDINIPSHVPENATYKFFGYTYAPFILQNGVRMIVSIIYVIYIVIAIFGCLNFREGLEPKNLVTSSHYIASYFDDLKLFWKIGPQLHVAVLTPPNFADPIQREQLMAMVRAFEDTEYTMGREGTVFFFLEYLNYLDQLNAELENTDRIWKQKLRSWLKYTGASNQWETDMVFNKTTNEIEAFRFQIALKNIVEPNQHKLAAKLLRKIADEQPFKVQIYHEAFPFADQYLIILPSTYRNVLISLCVMTCIAFLLIPSLPSAFLIVVSIISISTGVFGYMSLWGVNLDAISMISIIMSIGFAVDLSAHIVYAFVTADGDVHARVIGALEHLGWPIFQGAASTIIGVSVLYTVDAYIILTFFKTIWLTMVLGMTHGLLFIPIMLSFIPLGFYQIHEKTPPSSKKPSNNEENKGKRKVSQHR